MSTTRPTYDNACAKLSPEQRAHRLAAYLWDKPADKVITAGVCQVCGHKLPISYSAHVLRDAPAQLAGTATGPIEFEFRPCPTGAPEEANMRAKIAGGQLAAWETTGIWFADYCACEALNEDVWTQAQAINEQKRRERANVGKPAPAAPEPQIKQPRRFGQSIAPMSREQLTA
jgi:hypothetical protein